MNNLSFYKDIKQATASADAYAPDAIFDHVAQIHERWLEYTRNGQATDPATASTLTLATVILEAASSPTVETEGAFVPHTVTINGQLYDVRS